MFKIFGEDATVFLFYGFGVMNLSKKNEELNMIFLTM